MRCACAKWGKRLLMAVVGKTWNTQASQGHNKPVKAMISQSRPEYGLGLSHSRREWVLISRNTVESCEFSFLVRCACNSSKVDGFVPQTQHVNLAIVSQPQGEPRPFQQKSTWITQLTWGCFECAWQVMVRGRDRAARDVVRGTPRR